MMNSVQNTCYLLYLLIILTNVPTKAEVLRCYVCVDCDTVNKTHIETCVERDDSVTEAPITLEPSTNTITDTVDPENPHTTITNTPATGISSTDTSSTETMVTDGYDSDTSIAETSTTENTFTEAISTESPLTNKPDSTTLESITDNTNPVDFTPDFTPTVKSDTEDSEIAVTNGFSTKDPNTDTSNQHTETNIEKSTDSMSTTTTITNTPEIEVLSNVIMVDTNEQNTETSTINVANIKVRGEFAAMTPILRSLKMKMKNEYLTNTSDTHPHSVKVYVSDISESKKSRFLKNDTRNKVDQSSLVEMVSVDHSSRPRRGVIQTRREVTISGSEVRCVVASYAVNNTTKIVRGCSFLAGYPEDRCRELVGVGFTGNFTRCSVCEGNLCNSAFKTGITFNFLLLVLVINLL